MAIDQELEEQIKLWTMVRVRVEQASARADPASEEGSMYRQMIEGVLPILNELFIIKEGATV